MIITIRDASFELRLQMIFFARHEPLIFIILQKPSADRSFIATYSAIVIWCGNFDGDVACAMHYAAV